MKKLLIATAVLCLQAGLLGCAADEPEEPVSDYVWANKSGVDVRMIVVKDYPDESKFTYEKSIANGDTLHGYYYTNKGWYPYPYPYETNVEIIKVKLVFLNELEKCLIFDGEIDDSFDIRHLSLYEKKLVEKYSNRRYEYTYTITPEHMAMAREEDCQSSASD
ncbi:MAG: YgdI/YgdR family lipoprotein [Fibromonadaceae bacterium]|jgi:hypothetical protein|nr:YgdI/YgdR family lipoprotein [Fibromonadaceae bacterium]